MNSRNENISADNYKKQPIHVLMTGGGAPGAAGIYKCLSENTNFNITVADANPEAIGKYLSSNFETVPMADDPAFIDSLLSICRKHTIHVLLPLVTRELQLLADHIKEFELAGVKIIVSPPSSLDIANNKSRLYEFLQWRGIPVPDFRIIETVSQFEKAIQELGFPEKVVCFKPSVGNGSRGFRILGHHINELDLLFNQKPNTSYITFSDTLRILNTGSFPELLVSEYLPGEEYSVDCLANHGETILAIPRLRKKTINGISVAGEIVNNHLIKVYCTKIIKELNLHGNIGIQVKAAENGEFLLLEINPRVQGTISAILGAGVNLPVLAIKQELGLPITEDEKMVKWDTRFSRYWCEVFY